jgi:NADH dehydrogenase (ubiquinone) flavoprotein 1
MKMFSAKYSLRNFGNKFFNSFNLSRKTFNTTVPAGQGKKTHGGLKDQDRIFTNIYRDGDPFIEGALMRVPSSITIRVTGIKQRI